MKKYSSFSLPKINRAIEKILADSQKNTEAENYFIRPVASMLQSGGKRLRPLLTCLTFHSLGDESEDIYQLAAIPELIHNGTLIVDDIEDSSLTRRDQPCSYLEFGIPLAVNAGNMLFFWPLKVLEEIKMKPGRKLALYQVINRDLIKVHQGQGMDIYWSERGIYDVTREKYLRMATCKTSALISMSLQIGAIAAGTKPSKLKLLEKLAGNFGLAFQIRDDVLNLKTTGKWGKTSGEDISEGKLTWLIADCLNKASIADKKSLIARLKEKSKKEKVIAEVTAILEKYDVFLAAEEAVKKQQESARRIIAKLNFDKKFQPIWLELIDYLGQREK